MITNQAPKQTPDQQPNKRQSGLRVLISLVFGLLVIGTILANLPQNATPTTETEAVPEASDSAKATPDKEPIRYQPAPEDQGVKGMIYYIDPENSEEKLPLGNRVVFFYRDDDPKYESSYMPISDGLFKLNLPVGDYQACVNDHEFCEAFTVNANKFTEIEIFYNVFGESKPKSDILVN